MIEFSVELSQENPPLARAEVAGAAEALGGGIAPKSPFGPTSLLDVFLPEATSGPALASRLALSRRVLLRCSLDMATPLGPDLLGSAAGRSTAIRWVGSPTGSKGEAALHRLAAAWKSAGGTIELDHPDVRVWVRGIGDGAVECFVEVGTIDRRQYEQRRTPLLPFRRPVSLDPRLARVAVNLARVRPGDRVVDPFLGTGSLAMEAALVGARVTGVDVVPEMVRGALQNFAALGLHAESIVQSDAEAALAPGSPTGWDALVTDPPYGRASYSGGEEPGALLSRTLSRYASALRTGARMVVIVPGGPDPVRSPWTCVERYTDRVHRSLTREFRVYAATGHSAVNEND